MIKKKCFFLIGLIAILTMGMLSFFPCVRAARIPAVGKVLENGINIRTDSTVNAHSVGKLNRGDEVEIIGEKYGWFKIRLSENFVCYVSGDHLKRVGKDKVEVIPFALNMRLYPSLEAPIIGKIREGTILTLKATKGEWAKVVAYPYAWGWVHKKFIDDGSGQHNQASDEVSPMTQSSNAPKEKSTWRSWLNPQKKVALTPQAPEKEQAPVQVSVLEKEQAVELPQPEVIQPSVVIEEAEQAIPVPIKEEAKEKTEEEIKEEVKEEIRQEIQEEAKKEVMKREIKAEAKKDVLAEEGVPYVHIIEENQVIPVLLQEKPQRPQPQVHIIEREVSAVVPQENMPKVPDKEPKSIAMVDKVVDLTEDIKGKTKNVPSAKVSPTVKVIEQEIGVDVFTMGDLDAPTVYGKLHKIDRRLKGCNANFFGTHQSSEVLLNIDEERFNPDSFLDQNVKIQGEVKDEGCVYIEVETISLL